MPEINGSIKSIADTKTYPSGFSKREFVVTTEEKFPQDLKFEVAKDKCPALDGFSVGQTVEVNFNIRGNEYNGNHYVSLACWKITSSGGQSDQPATQRSSTPPQHPSSASSWDDDVDGDIPF